MTFTFTDPAFLAAASGTVTYQTPVRVQAITEVSTATSPMTASFGVAPTTGNVLVVHFCCRTAPSSITTTGWTLLKSQVQSGSAATYSYGKISDGSETNLSFAFTGGSTNVMFASEWSGLTLTVDASSSTDSSITTGGTGTVTSLAIPSVTTAHPSVLMAALALGSTPSSPNAAFTSEALTASTTANVSGQVGRLNKPTPGTYGTTASWTTARRATAHLIALRAATT